jgi:hypothetical protein
MRGCGPERRRARVGPAREQQLEEALRRLVEAIDFLEDGDNRWLTEKIEADPAMAFADGVNFFNRLREARAALALLDGDGEERR